MSSRLKLLISVATLYGLWVTELKGIAKATPLVSRTLTVATGRSPRKDATARIEPTNWASEELENKPRYFRTSEGAIQEAAVKINNFWRNFGKSHSVLHAEAAQAVTEEKSEQKHQSAESEFTLVESVAPASPDSLVLHSDSTSGKLSEPSEKQDAMFLQHNVDVESRFTSKNTSSAGNYNKTPPSVAHPGGLMYRHPYPYMSIPSSYYFIPPNPLLYNGGMQVPGLSEPLRSFPYPYNPYAPIGYPPIKGAPGVMYPQDQYVAEQNTGPSNFYAMMSPPSVPGNSQVGSNYPDIGHGPGVPMYPNPYYGFQNHPVLPNTST